MKRSEKVRPRICSRCAMQVGSNNWIKHWKKKHNVKSKAKMTDYNGYAPIPEPFFVSKPWQQRGSHECYSLELQNNSDDEKYMRVALADFIKEKHLKIPYFLKKHATDVYQVLGEDLYTLPPLKDCSGYGWIEMIIERAH